MVEDNPGYVVYNRLMRMLYEFNPIRDQVAGSIESIAEITAETLYNCHKAFYAPSIRTLCVAGDCDPRFCRAKRPRSQRPTWGWPSPKSP